MAKIPGGFFVSQIPPKMEDIVVTSGFQRVRQYLDINISGKKGNIMLLVGTRGIGKSTCLEYFNKYVSDIIKYDCTRPLDVGLFMSDLLSRDYDGRVTLILKEIALCLSDNKSNNIKNVIEAVNKTKDAPYFLFIDNLDRLYQSEDDLVFVKYFFRVSDPILKALSKKVVIFISCAPEWSEFLKGEDLSYMNFSNSIELKPLTQQEIRLLIGSRAESFGYKLEEIIDGNLLPFLKVTSGGNSRKIFQFLEKIVSITGGHCFDL